MASITTLLPEHMPTTAGPHSQSPPSPSSSPAKRIISRAHLQRFLDSPTHQHVIDYIQRLNEAVVDVKLTDTVQCSPAVDALLSVLQRIENIVEETPPIDNGKSRFGNPAFRTFYDKVVEQSAELHRSIPNLPTEHVTELSGYFTESWGNRTRVDYGSGMELNFICWLLCLDQLKILTPDDDRAVVIKLFWRYMTVARLLQTEYWLEPAGSHGAQGLDDYHFAVFIFGSAQLRNHKHLRPKAIHDPEILDEFAKDYMYFSYIRYINSIKTASLRWHSPMLDDISGVKTWAKVNSGMLKMYTAEVLAKLPVAQHFLFGTLLTFPLPPDGEELEGNGEGEEGVHLDAHGHVHVRGEGFGDCCGIAIPSAFAAAEAIRRKEEGSGGKLRRIPFD
ncbi:hypothetical protein MVLG_02973 [Microbotryum lychnidis-dioicae p1A1 Lamole]|uniref:Serine/threonine-protein phosphatase 2A activator n=1 Tax=Microbotryum lychnidis-dioicae (strain p1A1 Lamole / MvSl-1064) TaxID=683840 RepID=U5H6S5_USTV1|nr:hypothetical protein MVLG_02973 [Microbotryum lychnidis-dioicae p1A1 Lamole]|eukprot:KDE06777.1 hypothetical protein MVLG_02973 [Microbotryum lychnidis-dioicae p1A1 Lamole]